MQAFYLAQALGRLPGVRVHVIAPGEQLRPEDSHWFPIRGRVVVHRTPFLYSAGQVPLSAAIAKGLSIYQNLASDAGFQSNCHTIVHGQHFAGAFVGLHLRSCFNIPLVVTIHKTPIGETLDPTLQKGDPAYSHLVYLASLSIDRFIAGSHFFEAELNKHGLHDRTSFIYHGVPAEWLRGCADGAGRRRVREFIGLDDKEQLVLCAMRWDSRKNPQDFIVAAGIVAKELPRPSLGYKKMPLKQESVTG